MIQGQIDYTIRVPEAVRQAGQWPARPRADASRGERLLLGPSPAVGLTDVEPRFGVLHTRISLTGGNMGVAPLTIAFSVDRALTSMLRGDDLVHVSRSSCGCIGLSIIRRGQLVAAAGAITHVPLGTDVAVHTPHDIVQQAEAVFRRRDPEYRLVEHPIEVTVGDETRLLHRARVRLGHFEVFVVHGDVEGIPGVDACLSVARIGVCPDSAASLTAILLDSADAVEVSRQAVVP